MDGKRQFGIADFFVFFGMLAVSVIIGAYYAYKDRKKQSVENYYFGGRRMSPIPVGLSMAVSFISSITVLGYPSHAYLYGTITLWYGVSISMQVLVGWLYYIPLFQRLQVSSVYEYLEMRYHRNIRVIASASVIVLMVLYMGTTVYLTGLALNAVTPMDMVLSILLTAGTCTLYTTLGGMKAVVWNDTFQAAIMLAGSIALLIRLIVLVGGIGNVWEAVSRGNRDTFWEFDLDPTAQHTIWTIVVGNGINWVGSMCSNQAITQRYQSCKNVRDARIAAVASGIPMGILLFISALSGCAMYAYYEGCDPMTQGKIEKIDQTLPYLVMEIFEDVPGMAGLFVAAAYSGMLSTVSSGINSMAALILEDFLIPIRPNMSERVRLMISKFLSVLFGVITTGMAFLTEVMGSTIVQIVNSLFGAFGGPILGLYTIGMFLPWTNTMGAGVGVVSGMVFCMWIAIGGIVYGASFDDSLPLTADLCPNATEQSLLFNATDVTMTDSPITTSSVEYYRPLLADTLYRVSYLYLAPIGMTMTVLVALLVSFLTGKNNPKLMNPALFLPFVDNKLLPASVRRFFRFGVPEYVRSEKVELKSFRGSDDEGTIKEEKTDNRSTDSSDSNKFETSNMRLLSNQITTTKDKEFA